MKDKKPGKTLPHQATRLRFPADEKRHPWLSMLLEAYHIIDKGIAEAVKTEIRKGRTLACKRGCSSCCKTHQTIPVYPLELVGLSWYVTEKANVPAREVIKSHLREYKENDPCPFLVEGGCSVHPLRPASCRQFNVFEKPCDEGEDPYYTRREDVLTPIRKYVDRAFFLMLPFYGVEDEKARWNIIESGSIHHVVKLLQTCNWQSLADKMDEFERQNAAKKE
jgi:Fe-S-cluster containining protein